MERPVFFPRLNQVHDESLHENHGLEESHQIMFLSKRCTELLEEKDEVVRKVLTLSAENTRLLASTKSWMFKYQEAIAGVDSEGAQSVYNYWTPTKKLMLE